jgi:rubrerythrin
MATPSKHPKLTYEILAEQSKEKEINDLKNQLEKQRVGNQELLDSILDLKNQLAFQKDKLYEKDEALKINEENIAELKSLVATEEYLKKQMANQRDKIQEQYDVLRHPLDHLPDEDRGSAKYFQVLRFW